MAHTRGKYFGFGPPAALALLLAACSAGGESSISGLGTIGGSSAVPYQHANAISAVGYKESQLGPDRYRIEVAGYPDTPPARLEKIAATRAAEIGRGNRLRYFKLDNLQHATSCKPARSTYRGGGHRELNYRILTADVSYAPTASDPAYLESRASFDQLRAELDQPQPAGDVPPFHCAG